MTEINIGDMMNYINCSSFSDSIKKSYQKITCSEDWSKMKITMWSENLKLKKKKKKWYGLLTVNINYQKILKLKLKYGK